MDNYFAFMDNPDFLLEKYRTKPHSYPIPPDVLAILDKIKFETSEKLI